MPVRTVSQKFSHPSEGRFSKNYGADQQRLQISDPHFDKFPNPATLACWKIRFNTEVCSCANFPAEAMLWIREVEMVDLLEEQKAQTEERFLRGRQIAYLIHDYFRLLALMIQFLIMPTCLQLLFETTIFRNSIRDGTIFYYR